MSCLCIPAARPGGLFKLLRAIWTAPTTLIGHAFAWLFGAAPAGRVGGTATRAYLYRLPVGRCQGLGAIAIGHVVVVEPAFMHERHDWLLAHELSHARQHDWLGPTYLVVHGLCQLVSALASKLAPVPGFPPQHAYNPLERLWLCVPFDILAAQQPPSGAQARALLQAFGISAEPEAPHSLAS